MTELIPNKRAEPNTPATSLFMRKTNDKSESKKAIKIAPVMTRPVLIFGGDGDGGTPLNYKNLLARMGLRPVFC